jgi:hypothetical protein
LFGWLSIGVMASYLAVMIAKKEAAFLPIAIAFLTTFLTTAALSPLFLRRWRRHHGSPSPRVGKTIIGAGVVSAYLAATAFQDLPTGVKATAIGGVMGVPVAGALIAIDRSVRPGRP